MIKLDEIQTLPQNIQFTIARPTGRGKSFRLRYRLGNSGPWLPYPLDVLDAANGLFQSGVVDEDTTYQKLAGVRSHLYAKRETPPPPEYSNHNQAVLSAFWAAEYPPRRTAQIKYPQLSRREYELSILAIDPLPIDTAPLNDLADKLFENYGHKPHALLRRALWLNSLLVYLGRDKIGNLGEKLSTSVTYVNEDEFQELLAHVKDPFEKALMRIAFYTGLRIGEIFGLLPRNVQTDHIHVTHQMYLRERGGTLESTKTKKKRFAVLPSVVRDDTLLFAHLSSADKRAKRDIKYSKKVRKICHRLWPDDPEKQLTFHALRHSNAIWLLQKGASLHEVAQHLGNHYQVTEMYYSGFELKKESIARLHRLVG
jgi:integrase